MMLSTKPEKSFDAVLAEKTHDESEDEAQERLFVRARAGLVPTADALAVLRHAEAMEASLGDLVAGLSAGPSGRTMRAT